MKKWIIPLLVLVGLAFAMYSWGVGKYNESIRLDEEAKTAWSNVESSYQRRADLIPNLVSTVRGYADFEQETLENVIKARASATSTTIDPTNLTAENMAAFQTAQNSLSGALSRLLVTIERYPDLKANQNFLELQSQLEGTENRINVERNRYNTAVKTYNQQIRKFPYTLFAGMFGFEQMTPYEAAEGSDVAPEVVF